MAKADRLKPVRRAVVPPAKTPHEQAALQRQIDTADAQIDATDRQIDQLVYELYGLTEEEIAIVEENVGR